MRNFFLFFLVYLLFSCASTGLKVINHLAHSNHYNEFVDIKYGDSQSNKLNIYIPTKQKTIASIVFYYGCCWGHCNKYTKDDYLFIADTLTRHGYAVVIPDYRQYPLVKFAEILLDAKKSTQWAIQHLKDYGVEGDSIFIMGHSSGAQIGAMLVNDETVLNQDLSKVKGFIGLAGPYDFFPFNGQYMYDLFSSENNYFSSQPIHFVNGNEPSHLLLQGKNDQKVFVHNAVNLDMKLNENGVESNLVVFDKMSHIKILLSLSKPLRNNSKVLKSIVQFINASLL